MSTARFIRRTALLVGVVLAVIATTAAGATFVVTKTADTNDGVCDADCSLREAIIAANALAGADTITLPAGIYTLTIPGAGEDAAATGDLDITADLTINGAGAATTIIDGNGAVLFDRVVHILAGTTVTISGLTIQNGLPLTPGSGGGIFSQGSALILTNSTVSGNTAFHGGGIWNSGMVTLNSSTVSGNSASGGIGGGIVNVGIGTLTLNNSTVSGNSIPSGGGGGIFNFGGTVTLNNSTVNDNSGGSGGGIYIYSGAASLKNTIVANSSSGGNCAGSITSLGHNLSSDATCAFAGPGDLNNTNPLLGPLANNGGPTETHALLAGSPAIDAVPLASCTVSTDQRGVSRPQGAACDIGAYEVEAACVPPPPGMVAWWPLNETSGTVVIDIAGGHNGMAQPDPVGAFTGTGPVTSTTWPPPTFPVGIVGNSMFFYSQRRIEVPSHADLEPGTGDFTIDAWVIYAAAGHGNLLTIARKGLPTFPGPGWGFLIRDYSLTQGGLGFYGGQFGGGVEEPITPNTWHHVSATLSTAANGFRTVKVYVDGVSSGAIGLNGDITSTADLLIGGDGVLAGEIAVDEVEIFNSALTQTEIQAIYHAGSAGKCKPCFPPPSGMVAWYPLDELPGATAITDIARPPSSSVNNAGTPRDANGGPTSIFAAPGPPPAGPVPVTSPPLNLPSGLVGSALYFLGPYIQVPNHPEINVGNGDFTIDVWVYPVHVEAGVIQPIVDQLDLGANRGYSLYIRSPGIFNNARLEFVWGDGNFLTTVQSISPIAYDQAHHVAVTFQRLQPVNPGDPSFEVKLYVNGALLGQQSGAPPRWRRQYRQRTRSLHRKNASECTRRIGRHRP